MASLSVGSCKRVKLNNFFTWKAEPVLSNHITKDITVQEALACHVSDKKQLSEIVKQLLGVFPLNDWKHLKRVKNLNSGGYQVLVCPTNVLENSADMQSVEAYLIEKGLDLTLMCNPEVVKVSVLPPITRTQFEAASSLWPTCFHESKYLLKLLSDDYFDDEQLSQIELHMKLALDSAKNVMRQHDKWTCSPSCVIVNPGRNNVLCAVSSQESEHPLKHAAIVAVDTVAQQQLHSSAVRLPGSAPDTRVQYLCTGYEAYLVGEPCVMCAMALLHSRILRVFYGCALPGGALGSQYSLHTIKSLNHHFEVFRGIMLTECRNLMKL